jgi:hypothetical protein
MVGFRESDPAKEVDTMTLPAWLLDVDGVLNAVVGQRGTPPKSAGWPQDSWRDFIAEHHGDRFRIVAAEPVLDVVRRAHEEKLAEVQWLTTWEDGDAILTEMAPKLGLPEFPIAGRQSEFPGWARWWKLPITQRVYAEDPDRDLLWTDDDISRFPAAKQWVNAHRDRITAISPNDGQGLIRAHVEKIVRWLETPRG